MISVDSGNGQTERRSIVQDGGTWPSSHPLTHTPVLSSTLERPVASHSFSVLSLETNEVGVFLTVSMYARV